MIILSINAGSSSLKFTGFKMPEEEVLISGVFERIGSENSFYSIKINGEKVKKEYFFPNHEIAVKVLLQELLANKVINSYEEIGGIGHRVVHGGAIYSDSILINEAVKDQIRNLIDIAPLHNPANLSGIEVFEDILPNTKNVAVFDTAFHQTMKPESYIYPTPYEWYTNYGVRKYGFHGTSHKYINHKISEELGRNDLKVISCHLGNGCSISAIDAGRCIDTSLGFSPLPGLMMGTRCGDIDPSIIPYIMQKTGNTIEQVMNDLNKKSGYLGVSGISHDSRDIEDGIKEGNERCILAQEIFVNRVVAYIANYYVLLGGADVICFAGGVGENAPHTRKGVLDKLKVLGIYIDDEANLHKGKLLKISNDQSKTLCYIIPTDEELMIARDTYELIK